MANEFYDAPAMGQSIVGAASIVQRQQELELDRQKVQLNAIGVAMQNPDNSPFQNFELSRQFAEVAGLPEPDVSTFTRNQQAWKDLTDATVKGDQERAMTAIGGMSPQYVQQYAEKVKALQMGLAPQGFQQLAERGGLKGFSQAEAAATMSSGPMQAAIAGRAAPDPKEEAQAKLWSAKADHLSLQDQTLSDAQMNLANTAISLIPDVQSELNYQTKISNMSETARKSIGLRNAQLTGTNALKPEERKRTLEMAKDQLEAYQTERRGVMEVLNKQQLGVPGFEGSAAQTSARLHSLNQAINLRQAEIEYLTTGSTDSLKRMQGVQYNIAQQLNTLKEARKNIQQQQADVALMRLGVAQGKEAFAQESGKAHTMLSKEYLTRLESGMSDTQAMSEAVKATTEAYPNTELHPEKLKNPEKTGSLKILGEKAQSDISEAMVYLDQMDEIMDRFKPQYVGPIDAVVTKFGQMSSTLSNEREQFTQDLRTFKQGIRSSAFGAALTKQELERAISEIPDETMGHKQFKAAIGAWQKKWKAVVRNRIKTAKANKRQSQVSSYDDFVEAMVEKGASREEVQAFLATQGE